MAGITKNKIRNGNFTSSKVSVLLSKAVNKVDFAKPALTYIKEKNWERKLKRSISTDVSSRPMLWGSFLESRVHDLLPTEYEHINNESIAHPIHLFWVGSPDHKVVIEKVVADTKCPQPKAFCELVDNLLKAVEENNIDHFKNNHDEYYWQLVSNCCILGYDFIEIIVYLPYESELTDIRLAAENWDGEDQYKYKWIYDSDREELAYQPDDSGYKNLYRFRFPLSIPDAVQLEQTVIKAAKLLNAVNE